MFAEPFSGRDLAAFVAAVETASMHGAADALGLTQSAVSKRIAALERRAGAELLRRGRLGVRPTTAGRLLYPEAKHALAALDRAAAVADRVQDAHRHELRLAASHTIGEFLAPGWLADFRAAGDGDLHAQLDVVNSTGVLAAVRRGDVEIGFVEGLDSLDGLERLNLMRDELVVVVAPSHRWTRRRAITPAELASEPYLSREADSGTRAVATAALHGHGLTLAPALETPSTQGLKRAVLSGGFTIISRVCVQAETQAGTLAALPIAGVDLHRELRAVRRRRPVPQGAPRAMWRWLRERGQAGDPR